MQDKYELENFDSVWERVTSANNDSEPDSAELIKLRGFMDMEATGAAEYTRLIRNSRGMPARILSEITGEKKRRLKLLETVHFIMTGDTYAPTVERGECVTFLEALRDRYQSEVSSARAYKKAWNEAENERLLEIYADFSAESVRHVRMLEDLISTMMG